MNESPESDSPPGIREEYDFSRGQRGKYAVRYAAGSNVVVLEPDVAELYPDSRTLNEALRVLARSVREPRQGS